MTFLEIYQTYDPPLWTAFPQISRFNFYPSPLLPILTITQGIYSFYNEFLPNGTRNPLAVHQVLEDRLRLVARTAMPDSAPGAEYEIGYIRLPFQFLPGMIHAIDILFMVY